MPPTSAQVLRSAQDDKDDKEVQLADLVTRFGVCCTRRLTSPRTRFTSAERDNEKRTHPGTTIIRNSIFWNRPRAGQCQGEPGDRMCLRRRKHRFGFQPRDTGAAI